MSGQSMMEPRIVVQPQDFNVETELGLLRQASGDIGAIVTFTGLCRSEGGRLLALELEHYPGMAETQIKEIAQRAIERWPLSGLTAVHRHGRIEAGEQIVFVACTSQHRKAAFDGASFLMDYLKTHAPFWKKQIFVDGTRSDWVAPKQSDEADLERW